MAITYEWVFGPLETTLQEDGMTNVVKTVHWRLNAVDGNYSETTYGTVGLESPTLSTFIDYEDLTKEQVQGWVENALGAERVAEMKRSLENSINLKKNPVSATLAPPWEATA